MEPTELPREIERIGETYGSGDLLDRQLRTFAKELSRFIDSELQEVGDRSVAGFFLKMRER